MEIYTSIDPIKLLNRFNQLDHPVALTPPLIANDQVIVRNVLFSKLFKPLEHFD